MLKILFSVSIVINYLKLLYICIKQKFYEKVYNFINYVIINYKYN